MGGGRGSRASHGAGHVTADLEVPRQSPSWVRCVMSLFGSTWDGHGGEARVTRHFLFGRHVTRSGGRHVTHPQLLQVLTIRLVRP